MPWLFACQESSQSILIQRNRSYYGFLAAYKRVLNEASPLAMKDILCGFGRFANAKRPNPHLESLSREGALRCKIAHTRPEKSVKINVTLYLIQRQLSFVRFLAAKQKVCNRTPPRAAKTYIVPIWAFGLRQMPKSAPKNACREKAFCAVHLLIRGRQTNQNLVDAVLNLAFYVFVRDKSLGTQICLLTNCFSRGNPMW